MKSFIHKNRALTQVVQWYLGETMQYILGSPYSQGWSQKNLNIDDYTALKLGPQLDILRIGTAFALRGYVHFWDWRLREELEFILGVRPAWAGCILVGNVACFSVYNPSWCPWSAVTAQCVDVHSACRQRFQNLMTKCQSMLLKLKSCTFEPQTMEVDGNTGNGILPDLSLVVQ